MKQLTYKIAHIKVGEEDYWEEVEGFISGSKDALIFVGGGVATKNDNHPLSTLANDLGAIIYGGLTDEKDFYLLLPFIDIRQVGDIFIYYHEAPREPRYCMLGCGQFKLCEDFHNKPSASTYGFYWKFSDDYDDLYCFTASLLGSKPVLTNIFQEYARTGIIENDLYKQFFK